MLKGFLLEAISRIAMFKNYFQSLQHRIDTGKSELKILRNVLKQKSVDSLANGKMNDELK